MRANPDRARAFAVTESNVKVQRMNSGISMGNVHLSPQRREPLSLREIIPFWFAVSSPLIGAVLGVGGVWLLSWLTG